MAELVTESEESATGSRSQPGAIREFGPLAGAPQGPRLALLLLLAVLAVFSRSASNGFVDYDDGYYVTDNPIVQQGLTREGFVWAFRAVHAGNWHPLTWLSHMLDCELWGLEPAGHHWTSVGLHALNALLLFALLRRMTGELGPSAFVAALFALHPLRVESVAWVAERKDLLSALFAFLALHAWLGWARKRRVWAWLAALGLFAASLASKAMLVTLPFLLLLLDLWPLARLPDWTWRRLARLVLEKLPFFALAGAASFVALWSQGPGIQPVPPGTRVANALLAYASYLELTLWPRGLAALYPYDLTPAPLAVAGAALLLASLSALVVWRARPQPYLLVGWLWFVGLLVPVIGLVQIGLQARADRYTYLPQIGLLLMAAWGIPALLPQFGKRRGVLTALALVAAVVCGAASWAQIAHWRSTRTLFERAVEVTHDNWFAHTELGIALGERGELHGAELHLRRALELQPAYPRARANWGNLLLHRGDARAALVEFAQALAVNPRMREVHHHSGRALEALGERRGALAEYQTELERNPDYVPSLQRAALLLGFSSDPAERDTARAYALAEQACRATDWRDVTSLDLLASLAAQLGRFDRALEYGERARELAQEREQPELAEQIERRLVQYRAGRALRP